MGWLGSALVRDGPGRTHVPRMRTSRRLTQSRGVRRSRTRSTAGLMKELGYEVPPSTYAKHVVMGKEFDPKKPDEYLKTFDIQVASR